MVWNVSPVLFSLGSFSVRWYGALFAIGFYLGYRIVAKLYHRDGRSDQDIEKLFMSTLAGTLMGARLGHCLFYEPAYYLSNPIQILFIWQGGLASHGAAAGVMIATYLYSRKRVGQSFLYVMDRLVIGIALGGAFIRLGNLFNSEIIGRPTDLPWAVTFARVDSLPRHPAQVYEAIIYLLSFAALWWIHQKTKIEGRILGWFFIFVFGSRFLIEFLKEHQSAFESQLPLDMGQILSIPLVVVGVWLVLRKT